MTTDTSEHGLETLIVDAMTGGVAGSAVEADIADWCAEVGLE